MTDKTDKKAQASLKLGLVATDPLRILGLQTIFSEDGIKGEPVEIIPLSVPRALDASGKACGGFLLQSGDLPGRIGVIERFCQAKRLPLD